MAKIFIVSEDFESAEELNMFSNFQNAAKWYIGPDGDSDETRKFLTDFISAQDSFPVFLVMEPFGDVSSELVRLLEDNRIAYTVRTEGMKNKSIPVLKIVLKDAHSLKIIVDQTFWIANSNNFYALSFSDNCTYKSATRKTLWGRKKPYMHPFFEMKEASTVISIWYDGDGFNLYTNDHRYKTLESLKSHLPEGTLVEEAGSPYPQ
ncbi:hypothetical protein QMA09_09205 [Planococcus sp. APC 3906]|uniref:hypothetical protein n=1 Tax=Planococcus sp. APC 3906 TaxID=3035194 RepID=UPI0025B5AE08|nr:hypothetical protein [Planococcus sp. APC 3906]MDN3450368.1 hypothetical protein [Planococcus sp. APC 3906]